MASDRYVAVVRPVPLVKRFENLDLMPAETESSGHRHSAIVSMLLDVNTHFLVPACSMRTRRVGHSPAIRQACKGMESVGKFSFGDGVSSVSTHVAIRTSILPKFLPCSRPRNAAGAFSSPSTMSSRYLRRPVRTHSPTSRKKSACFAAKSETMNPRRRTRATAKAS